MQSSTTLHRFGELTKEEPVSTISSDVILPDTVVFEAVSPYFGYYNDAPLSDKKPYIYLVLDVCPTLNLLHRAVINIKNQLTHPLRADLGSIRLASQTLPVIRIKEIEKFCRIKHIQKHLMNEGITFKSSFRQVNEEMAEIHLQKFLKLQEVGDGLFFDMEDPNKGYLVVPRHLNWESFKKLTTEAKYDTSILYFDAAQAVLFENDSLTDLVRIYREHLAVEKLAAIRERYLKLLQA